MGSYSGELYQISSNVVFDGTRFRTMRVREEKESAKWISLQTRIFVEDAEKAFQDYDFRCGMVIWFGRYSIELTKI